MTSSAERTTDADAAGEAPAGAPQWRPLDVKAWLLLPAALTLLAYGFTLDGFFLADDFHLVENARKADDWVAASHMHYSRTQSWLRPVVHWSFWLQWLTSGLEPFGYRLFNIVLHALNCAGVAWVAALLVGTRRAGTVAGVAFALLPIHPEAVTWISGRSDLLCATGLLIALLAWCRFCTVGGKYGHLVLACLGLAFALAAKEMAAVGVLLLAAISMGFFPSSLRRQWFGLGLFVVLTAAYCWIHVLATDGLGISAGEGGGSLQARIDVPAATHFVLKAVELTTAPLHRENYSSLGRLVQLIPLAGWALLFCAGLACTERGRLARRGVPILVLFLLSTSPVANWGSVNEWFMSTRYLYVPSIFSCAGLGLLTSRLGACSPVPASRGQTRSVLAGLACILPLWSVQLVQVNRMWDAAGDLSRRVVEALPPPSGPGALRATDLPDNDRGAYVFRSAFGQAAQLYAGWPDGSRQIAPEDWQGRRLRATSAQVRAGAYQRWLSDEERWTTAPIEAVPRAR